MVGCGAGQEKSGNQTGECAGRSWGGELDWKGEMGAMEGSRAAEELVAWVTLIPRPPTPLIHTNLSELCHCRFSVISGTQGFLHIFMMCLLR